MFLNYFSEISMQSRLKAIYHVKGTRLMDIDNTVTHRQHFYIAFLKNSSLYWQPRQIPNQKTYEEELKGKIQMALCLGWNKSCGFISSYRTPWIYSQYSRLGTLSTVNLDAYYILTANLTKSYEECNATIFPITFTSVKALFEFKNRAC